MTVSELDTYAANESANVGTAYAWIKSFWWKSSDATISQYVSCSSQSGANARSARNYVWNGWTWRQSLTTRTKNQWLQWFIQNIGQCILHGTRNRESRVRSVDREQTRSAVNMAMKPSFQGHLTDEQKASRDRILRVMQGEYENMMIKTRRKRGMKRLLKRLCQFQSILRKQSQETEHLFRRQTITCQRKSCIRRNLSRTSENTYKWYQQSSMNSTNQIWKCKILKK